MKTHPVLFVPAGLHCAVCGSSMHYDPVEKGPPLPEVLKAHCYRCDVTVVLPLPIKQAEVVAT